MLPVATARTTAGVSQSAGTPLTKLTSTGPFGTPVTTNRPSPSVVAVCPSGATCTSTPATPPRPGALTTPSSVTSAGGGSCSPSVQPLYHGMPPDGAGAMAPRYVTPSIRPPAGGATPTVVAIVDPATARRSGSSTSIALFSCCVAAIPTTVVAVKSKNDSPCAEHSAGSASGS